MCLWKYVRVYARVCVCVCVCVCMNACMYVCMGACICGCISMCFNTFCPSWQCPLHYSLSFCLLAHQGALFSVVSGSSPVIYKAQMCVFYFAKSVRGGGWCVRADRRRCARARARLGVCVRAHARARQKRALSVIKYNNR